MKNNGIINLYWLIAGVGLLLTILPPLLVFARIIEFKTHTFLMVLGMLIWFGARIAIQSRQNER